MTDASQLFMRNFVATETEFGIISEATAVCKVCGRTFSYHIWGYRHADGTPFGCDKNPRDICEECARERSGRKLMDDYWDGKIAERQEAAHIPALFQSQTLETYRVATKAQEEARAKVYDWAVGKKQNLCVYGARKTGKTHLVCAALRQAMRHDENATALYTTESDLYRAIRETYSKKGMTEREVLAYYSGFGFLAIDEIGRSAWSDADKRILFDLINDRYNNRRHTAVATNLTPESFADKSGGRHIGLGEYLGDAVSRRILETDCALVVCSWAPYGGGVTG